ncbi:ectonucleoside triphosphate diphosphohydrolase 8-like [Anneissia japonica]|uniref:ectonucleoside triphosphate diphosphohydrolase 8-like n=1 Tax=Anneissia japonica TaxID=1529436 RepID=UPI0014259E09|nr:ectonucleoside triphosphate diphosphohydrolase 8-like [Anneissia japonica]
MDEPAIRRGRKCTRILFLSGFLLTLLGAGLLTGWLIWGNRERFYKEYGIVLDAGSSHTNLFVYQWPGSKKNGTGIVKQRGVCVVKGGGISSYVETPEKAGPSLEECFDTTALHSVPRKDQEETPVFLGATAGMRLLDETSPDISDAILNSTRRTISSYPFNFTDDQARIITGTEEGIFGWITTNFLLHSFNDGSSLERHVRSLIFTEDAVSTVGALDLGGASTQITFIPEDPASLTDDHSQYLRLYGTNYTVYTHSYLCYGMNEARRQLYANLIKDADFAENVTNPCGALGLVESFDGAYLWEAPCSNNQSENVEFQSANNSKYYFSGSSDPEACLVKVRELFNFSAPCEIEPCSFDGVYQPPPYGKFLAFSGYYYAINNLNLTSNVTLNQLNTTRDEFCQRNWTDIKEIPGLQDNTHVFCFDINYVYVLLVDAYNFTQDNWNIEFVRDVDGANVGWSLGYMVNATNGIPTEPPSLLIHEEFFYGLLACYSIIAFVGVLMLLVCAQRRWKQKNVTTYVSI